MYILGLTNVQIDGKTVKNDKERGTGFYTNASMMTDPYLKNVCLNDMAGGSVAFYDSAVKLEKLTGHFPKTMKLI